MRGEGGGVCGAVLRAYGMCGAMTESIQRKMEREHSCSFCEPLSYTSKQRAPGPRSPRFFTIKYV